MSKEVKKIQLSEAKLVDLIENTVSKVVAKQKQQWIAEQEAKNKSILESKVAKLEETILKLTEGKK